MRWEAQGCLHTVEGHFATGGEGCNDAKVVLCSSLAVCYDGCFTMNKMQAVLELSKTRQTLHVVRVLF